MRDYHLEITDTIISALETVDKTGTWKCPWHKTAPDFPLNATTGAKYNGINTVHLWIVSQLAGYKSNKWATFKQWNTLGARVKRGEKSSAIIYYQSKQYEDDDGNEYFKKFSRFYYVFNSEQIVGWTDPDVLDPPTPEDAIHAVELADEFIKGTKAKIVIGGENARYVPNLDKIEMPDRHLFIGTKSLNPTEAWYSTLLHELVHWSGGEERLDRFRDVHTDKSAYAYEELIAELGSAFLCAQLGITPEPRVDHVQYLSHWVEMLRSDKNIIFQAAAAASKAAALLNELQNNEKFEASVMRASDN